MLITIKSPNPYNDMIHWHHHNLFDIATSKLPIESPIFWTEDNTSNWKYKVPDYQTHSAKKKSEVVELYFFCGKLYLGIDIYKFAIRDEISPCLYRLKKDEQWIFKHIEQQPPQTSQTWSLKRRIKTKTNYVIKARWSKSLNGLFLFRSKPFKVLSY